MGLLDMWNASPGSAQDIRMEGLLGGLSRMGAMMAQAGQLRPVGQPGSGMAEAFLGFGEGQRAGVQNATQMAQMQRKAAQQAVMAEARSSKPDDQISERARSVRGALAGMPASIGALVDDDDVSKLAIQRETQRQRPMTPDELRAGGHPAGSQIYINDFTGTPNVLRQSQMLTPDELAQDLLRKRATMQPQTTWKMIPGTDGQPIAQVSSLGEYRPLRQPSEGYTLGPDQTRFGANNQPVAAGVPGRPNLPVGMEMKDGVAVQVPGVREAQAAAEAPKQAAATANDLRGEYTKLTTDFRTVQDAYQKITMAGNTGQGDLALLYSYMKILDPTSVVRESEFALAAKSGSFGEQMQGMVTRVINGERLPDTVRKGFRDEARSVYQAQAKSYMNTQGIYRDLATRGRANPDDVVLPFKFDGGVGGGGSGDGGKRDPLGILK